DKIEGRIKKLDEFITSMLDYARVNRGETQSEQINLREIIQDCIRELDHLENFNAVKTEVQVTNENLVFKNDPLRVRIIMSNIISNAYKYHNPAVKSKLKINAAFNPMFMEIVVSDNGIGIKSEHLKKIFNMFYRATEKSQGSGLGMYIVKQAVDKLKGNIRVKSVFGKGTTIKIVIPNN
ncbi:MAG TPA: HAMP domain-containing sensor histidine kinase, partial [Cyclobacteriaceae bacterium]|nr:HAMP domain-containing sensor histidine kinase [Cyclobacteriaceae bacterium]